MKKKAFCICCDTFVDFTIKHRANETKINNVDICYDEQYALCPNCGTEIYVPEINDANCIAKKSSVSSCAQTNENLFISFVERILNLIFKDFCHNIYRRFFKEVSVMSDTYGACEMIYFHGRSI